MKKIVLLMLLYTTSVYSAAIGTITEQTAAPGSIVRNKNTISGSERHRHRDAGCCEHCQRQSGHNI
jgi:hypothetical protein